MQGRLLEGRFKSTKRGSFSTVIMKTCPCNVYPLKPHLKLGYAGVDEAVLTSTHNLCFEQK